MEKVEGKQNDDVELEEWCFACHDGGKLRECDYPNCGKAYHYKCVGQKRSFLAANENWICARHSCSSCGGKPTITCYCCPTAICHQCIDAAEFFPIRGENGFCNDCMNLVLLVEGIMESDSNMKRKLVDFSKREMYLGEYYEIIKKQEGITLDDLQSAKGQWKIREKRKSGMSLDDVDEKKRHKVLPNNEEVVSNTIATPFASIVPENIRLVYLRRSLVEKLLKQPESFEDKVKGTFVCVELPSNDVHQRKAHQLVQVTGTTSDQDGMAVKLQASNIPNDIPIHTLSDADLFEKDCEDLRQQMQSGLLRRPTVDELEKKARILHEDMVDDLIAKELKRLQPRIDQANEKGRRQEFFSYLNRKKQLEAPSERLRLIHKLPVVIPEVPDVNTMSKEIVDDKRGDKSSPESIPIKDPRPMLNDIMDDKKRNEGSTKIIRDNKCKGSETASVSSLSDLLSGYGAGMGKKIKRKSESAETGPSTKQQKTGSSSSSPIGQSSSAAIMPTSTPTVLFFETGSGNAGRGKQLSSLKPLKPTKPLTVAPEQAVAPTPSSSSEKFVPDWEITKDDQATTPEVATQLLLKGVLPKDAKSMENLSFDKLTDVVATSIITANASVAELYLRSRVLQKAQDSQVVELKKQLQEVKEMASEHLKAWRIAENARATAIEAQEVAQSERDQALAEANSLRIAHAKELKSLKEEQEKMQEELEIMKAEEHQKLQLAQEHAIKEFLAPDKFAQDLKELAGPTFVLGFTKAVDEVSPLLTEEQKIMLEDHANYNLQAAKLVDRMAEGIKEGRDLLQVRAEFNAEEDQVESIEDLFGGKSTQGPTKEIPQSSELET